MYTEWTKKYHRNKNTYSADFDENYWEQTNVNIQKPVKNISFKDFVCDNPANLPRFFFQKKSAKFSRNLPTVNFNEFVLNMEFRKDELLFTNRIKFFFYSVFTMFKAVFFGQKGVLWLSKFEKKISPFYYNCMHNDAMPSKSRRL